MAPYDVIGNIVIVKFDRSAKVSEKKKFARDFLKSRPSVTTVLERVGKFSGRLRTQSTKFLAGDKTKEALCKENGCIFRLNVDSCYFSPRMATERKELAEKVKKCEEVLVMCGGVAPYAVVMAKMSKGKKFVSVELGRDCTKYAKQNVKRNKVNDRVEAIGGDVRKVLPKMKEKFDRIVMGRPNLKDSFLDVTFPRIKKGGIIHYYGFHPENERAEMLEMIKIEASKARRKIRILKIKKAGEIGVKTYRYRVDFKVLN